MHTPDTPPFTGMKRVFGSTTDFEAGNITPCDADTAANYECGDITARVVVFRKTKAEEEDEQAQMIAEEEEHAKFATLEASYPTHIQQESSTMCCGGDQSGRQLIHEEEEEEDMIEYY